MAFGRMPISGGRAELALTMRRRDVAIRALVALFGVISATAAEAQADYLFRGITTTNFKLEVAAPLPGRYSAQADVQVVSQSSYLDDDANPFAHLQRVHIRPWVHFALNASTRLSFSTSYVKRYAIPDVGGAASD